MEPTTSDQTEMGFILSRVHRQSSIWMKCLLSRDDNFEGRNAKTRLRSLVFGMFKGPELDCLNSCITHTRPEFKFDQLTLKANSPKELPKFLPTCSMLSTVSFPAWILMPHNSNPIRAVFKSFGITLQS